MAEDKKKHPPLESILGQQMKNATLESLQLEVEHLNGIITALTKKVRKTEDLEMELLSLRKALNENEDSRDELRKTIEEQSLTLQEHKTKSERFQALIIEENRNLNEIIQQKEK